MPRQPVTSTENAYQTPLALHMHARTPAASGTRGLLRKPGSHFPHHFLLLLFGEMCSVTNSKAPAQSMVRLLPRLAGMGLRRPFASPDAPVLLCIFVPQMRRAACGLAEAAGLLRLTSTGGARALTAVVTSWPRSTGPSHAAHLVRTLTTASPGAGPRSPPPPASGGAGAGAGAPAGAAGGSLEDELRCGVPTCRLRGPGGNRGSTAGELGHAWVGMTKLCLA
jgi:hypothetical protein